MRIIFPYYLKIAKIFKFSNFIILFFLPDKAKTCELPADKQLNLQSMKIRLKFIGTCSFSEILSKKLKNHEVFGFRKNFYQINKLMPNWPDSHAPRHHNSLFVSNINVDL